MHIGPQHRSPSVRARRLTAGVALTITGLVVGALPSQASDPASQDATVEAVDGATQTLTYTGSVLPGSEQTGSCAGSASGDGHLLTVTIPDGLYDGFEVAMSATVTGPANADLILTVVSPDGSQQSTDSGFVGVAETVQVGNPVAGTYDIIACPYASALPASYDGEIVITTKALAGTGGAGGGTAAPAIVCPAPAQSLKFTSEILDSTRAGGEPLIFRHPDGQLLWGSHAGTTHLYSPAALSPTSAAFVENYQGQTYYYISEDGASWDFVSRTPIDSASAFEIAGIPATGFSDPEFAVDQAGNVFISEINLANIAVSKSTDGGRTYGLANVFSFTISDRQWMAADREDELYMTANGFGGGSFPGGPIGQALSHFISKSTDGGRTFGAPFSGNSGGVGDIQIDWATGRLYEIQEAGGTLSMGVFPNIRDEADDFTFEQHTIAEGVSMSGVQRLIDPTFDMDSEGNLYVVFYENGGGTRAQGIWYSASTDQGVTWIDPVRVDPGPEAEIWPWIAVGGVGQVAITWLQTDAVVTEGLAAENIGADAPWHVAVAHSGSGLGCGADTIPGFTVTQATEEPVHVGPICQHGTTCQTDLTDRRLGDYFSIETGADGSVNVAVSDTRQGGSSSLPRHIRQVGGPTLDAAPEPPPVVEPPVAPEPTPAPTPLPATGGGFAISALGLMLAGSAIRRRS